MLVFTLFPRGQDGGGGVNGALHCKLMIKRVGQSVVRESACWFGVS